MKTTNHTYAFQIMLLMGLLLSPVLRAQPAEQEVSTEDLLREFTTAYQTDHMAMDATFGIRVGQQWWHVKVQRTERPYQVGKKKQYTFHELGPNTVELIQGPPAIPTWYFRFDSKEVLREIYNQTLTTGTASAKSTGADIVRFDIEDMDGFDSTQGDTALAYMTMEHFWKPQPVEITRFSRNSSLPSHGAEIVVLYTMKDKRISWFTLGQEEVANADRGLDKGQCPNLFIITKGRGKAQIGEEEIDLEPGMSVFVGPYVKHVLYNPNPEPLEGILVLYGDNVDYALGQSYPEFMEAQIAFYAENEKRVSERKAEVKAEGIEKPEK